MNVNSTNHRYLHIDWTKCDGRGLCTELLPDLLGRDKWGFPVAKRAEDGSRSNVQIPSRRMDAAQDAINLCPLLALRMLSTRGGK